MVVIDCLGRIQNTAEQQNNGKQLEQDQKEKSHDTVFNRLGLFLNIQ